MVSQQLGEAWVALTVKDQGLAAGLAGATSGILGSLGKIGLASAGIGAITHALEKMVSAANPALAQQIGFAWDDMIAAMGQGLMPVFEAVLPMIRSMGDLLMQLAPVIQMVSEVIAAGIDLLRQAIDLIPDFLKNSVGLGKASAAGASGTSQARMGDIAGAGRDAMVKSLQASAGVMGSTEIAAATLDETKQMKVLMQKLAGKKSVSGEGVTFTWTNA